MTIDAGSEIYYSPYDNALNMNPYPMLRRPREGAPLYYNAERDFYLLSRYDDVTRALVDHETFCSGARRNPRVDQGRPRGALRPSWLSRIRHCTTFTAGCWPDCSRHGR